MFLSKSRFFTILKESVRKNLTDSISAIYYWNTLGTLHLFQTSKPLKTSVPNLSK